MQTPRPRPCTQIHEILVVDEFNAHGAVVSCLRCLDTFQASEDGLEGQYYHVRHASPEGPDADRDLFIHYLLYERIG